MRYTKKVALLALSLLFISGCGQTSTSSNTTSEKATTTNSSSVTTTTAVNPNSTFTFPGVLQSEEIQNKQIRITTAKGDIVFELYPDTAPMTVSNFVYLTNQGYYDGLIFHRRDDSINIIQGGDPLGTGRGGPGYRFNDELIDDYTYSRGIVAMANAGPNTNGSQFFIMLDEFAFRKDYTIFGRVIEGQEVAEQIKVGDEMISVKVEDKK